MLHTPATPADLCPACGYDLATLTTPAGDALCPECGTPSTAHARAALVAAADRRARWPLTIVPVGGMSLLVAAVASDHWPTFRDTWFLFAAALAIPALVTLLTLRHRAHRRRFLVSLALLLLVHAVVVGVLLGGAAVLRLRP